MNWLRVFVPVGFALVVAWLVSGRAGLSARAPLDLIAVLDATPRDLERGDRLALAGTGFPAGKMARVTFRGTLRRPGETPRTNAEVELRGVAVGPERVELNLDEAAEALFCGAADLAVHTTFEGDVVVAFAAAVAGTPPVAGTLSNVTLDIRPTATGAAAQRDRDAEGARTLAALGLHVIPNGGGAGLRIESVDPRSRAAAAGLVPGDVVASFDGLRVGSTADVLPFPGEREAAIGMRAAGSPEETVRPIAVDGLRRTPPRAFLGSAMLIVSALAFVLLFCTPTPSGLSTRLAIAATRPFVSLPSFASFSPSAARGRLGQRAPLRRALAHALAFAGRDLLPPAGLRGLPDACAYAALAVMPLGQYLLAARLDVGVLFLGAAFALVVAALLSGRSMGDGVRNAARTAIQHVPAAFAILGVVVMTGSLRVQEIARAQGGCPWDWLAFRSPISLVLSFMLLSAARIDFALAGDSTGVGALVFSPAVRARATGDGGPGASGAVLRAHRILIAGLAAILFLGGWTLPGLAPAQQDARPLLQWLGELWLLAKTIALVAAVAGSRWAWPARRARAGSWASSVSSALGLFGLPAVLLGATIAWTAWTLPQAEQLLVSGSLVAVVVLVALAAAQRLRHALYAPVASAQERRLSPFL
jgi:NADH-quinone oxidoreductase subunit H